MNSTLHAFLSRSGRSLLAACAGASSTAHAGHVLVVSHAAGAPYATIQAAVEAATPGDVVLVRGRDFAGFTLDAKGVDIVGDPLTAPNSIASRVRIANVPAGQRCLVSSLGLHGGPFEGLPGSALLIEDCAGSVRVDRCTALAFHGASPLSCGSPAPTASSPAIVVRACKDVALRDCGIRGGDGPDWSGSALGYPGCGPLQSGASGGPGLLALDSAIVLAGCAPRGGTGGSGPIGGRGGAGVQTSGTTLHVALSWLTGGDGGDMLPGAMASGGSGGSALWLDSTSDASTLGSTFSPGLQGFGATAPPPQPIDGDAFVTAFPGSAKNCSGQAVVRVGQTIDVYLEGEPGDLGLALISPSDAHQSLGQFMGVLLGAPPLVVPVGLLDASGFVSVPVTFGPLPPGVETDFFVLQGFFVSSSLDLQLGTAHTVRVLDAAF